MVGNTLVVFAFAVIYVQAITTLPLAMSAKGLSPVEYGVTMSVNGLTILIVQPLVVGWLAKRDHSRVVAIGMILLGAGFGLAAFTDTTWQFICSVLIWTLGEIAFMTVAQTVVAALASPESRGRYNGFHGIAWSAANLAGPLGGAWLLHQFGSTTLWLTCLVVGLAGAAEQLALRPAIRRRAAVTPATA
jgi:MFS family permease